jgi:hypothetical protein
MSRRWLSLSLLCVFCVLLLAAGAGAGSNLKTPSGNHIGRADKDVNDANGPTVLLSYDSNAPESNPTSSFMYFVPLISPTLVDMEISANNSHVARIVSYKKKVTPSSFSVSCEFEMLGEGFFETIFDAPMVIEMFLPEQDKDESMANILDYIKFEGAGFGRVDVKGNITGSESAVTEVTIHFNARGHKSPVSIGLYSIEPKDGQFKYENKYNEMIARIASLTFRKNGSRPKMEVKLASVNKAANPNGFISKVKGVVANWFLNPIRISEIGNDTMLDFGLALLKEKQAFTFPKADNIRKAEIVEVKQ